MNRSNCSSVQTEIFPPENIENIRSYTKYTKRYTYTTGIMVFCFVIGTDLESAFEVKGYVGMSISNLREVIYEKNKNDFKNFDANKLCLWKVDIPGDTKDVKLKTLQSRSRDMDKENITIQELGGEKLTPFSDFGDIFMCDSKNIRVIVQSPPFFTDQGLTDVSYYIAKFGYLPRQGGLGGTLIPIDKKVRSSNEGVNINDSDISRRFDVIPTLIEDLEERNIILVRAPPFSGKTSMAQILEDTLIHAPRFSDRRIIRVSMLWRQIVGVDNCFDSFNEFWKLIIGIDWTTWIGQCRHIKTILIIDETQLIYGRERKVNEYNKESADQFWMTVKNALQEMPHIKIIMFAAYGYRSSFYTGFTTPVMLPESNYKSLVDILFSSTELKNYVEKFSHNYFKKLDPPGISKLYKYIQAVTEGHAGLVSHILKSIENAMIKRIDTNCLIWEEIFKYLNSKEFDKSVYTNVRAVPKLIGLNGEKILNDGQIKLCEEIFLNGKVYCPHPDGNVVPLIRSGILLSDQMYLTFAAPLFKRSFFQQHYGTHNSSESTPRDLHHFIVKIFTAMCNELSREILRKTLGFGSDGRILEQTWQKEFYRIGTQVLGKDHFLSCDVGSVFGCKGKIDYYVDKLDWAIELLRDGDDMAEHEERFEPLSGEYKEIVTYAKDIAIIDIRSEAKKVRKMRARFIHVSCSKDFDAFKIESLGKETITISFQN